MDSREAKYQVRARLKMVDERNIFATNPESFTDSGFPSQNSPVNLSKIVSSWFSFH